MKYKQTRIDDEITTIKNNLKFKMPDNDKAKLLKTLETYNENKEKINQLNQLIAKDGRKKAINSEEWNDIYLLLSHYEFQELHELTKIRISRFNNI